MRPPVLWGVERIACARRVGRLKTGAAKQSIAIRLARLEERIERWRYSPTLIAPEACNPMFNMECEDGHRARIHAVEECDSFTQNLADVLAPNVGTAVSETREVELHSIGRVFSGVFGLVLSLTSSLLAQGVGEPFLVKDIETTPGFGQASQPNSLAGVGNSLFFAARDPVTGSELWKSDGTFQGSLRVKDIVEGPGSSEPRKITDVGGIAFFLVDEQLWKSDGTESGTLLVKTLDGADQLTAVGQTLFFTASDAAHGVELWTSDGTPEGTVMVADIFPGEQGSNPLELTAVGEALFFSAEEPFVGRELWKSDGAGGAALVRDLVPGGDSGNPTELASFSDKLLFAATDFQGEELWLSDGTDFGTFVVADINAGMEGSSPAGITTVGPVAYFSAVTADFGRELWITDGTPWGTLLVDDIDPGSNSSDATSFIEIQGVVFFVADDGTSGRELWRTDGTEGGTFLFQDLVPGPESSDPEELTDFSALLVFTARTETLTRQLWRSDGSVEGTFQVPTACCLAADPLPHALTPVGNLLFFIANADRGVQLWKLDEQGFAFAVDLVGLVPGSSFPIEFISVGETMYFRAFESSTGNELWKSDGSESTTSIVKDISPGAESSGASLGTIVAVGDNLLFAAVSEGNADSQLWRSDGTETGTVLVKDIGGTLPSAMDHFFLLGGVLFFTANDGIIGNELWRSDGTSDGTFVLKDVNPGAASSFIGQVAVVGSTAFFSATVSGIGRELWKTDGTEAGTVLVADVWPGNGSSSPGKAVALDGVVFLSMNDGVHGFELWKSDGTESGTVLVKDIRPGIRSTDPAVGFAFENVLLFSASDDVTGQELWRTDGTEAGTKLVKDIATGVASSHPFGLQRLGDHLLFRADDVVHGLEIWTTDGTEEGTRLLVEIAEGPEGSSIQGLTTVRGVLLFTALTPELGQELYQSDGTAAGTVLVADIVPGPESSGADGMTLAGNLLFFSAEDPITGRELWAAELPNRTPVANAGPDQEVGEGAPVILDGSESFDPDGDGLTFDWRDSEGTVLGSTSVLTLPSLAPGEYEFTLTVSDGVDSDFDVVLVNVLGPPTISVFDTSVVEGHQGLSEARLRVELSRASTSTVYMLFVTLPQSATPLFDFVPKIGVIQLPPGVIEAEIAVNIVGERRCESDETFRVELFLPVNAELGDGSATATILNDDCSQ